MMFEQVSSTARFDKIARVRQFVEGLEIPKQVPLFFESSVNGLFYYLGFMSGTYIRVSDVIPKEAIIHSVPKPVIPTPQPKAKP